MKKLILIALLLVAFVTFSFRMMEGKKSISSKEEVASSQGDGFLSSDPIN
jgi:hypothetical protein